jgi:hypothetical protein
MGSATRTSAATHVSDSSLDVVARQRLTKEEELGDREFVWVPRACSCFGESKHIL